MAERQFQTQLVRFGAGGLNIRPEKDVVPPTDLPVMTNVVRLRNGAITARPGQLALTTAVPARTRLHSIGRLDVALTATFQRLWGIDAELYYGATGLPVLAEAGFSGDPLTMIPADGPIPGDPWMYIADRTKMRKIRADGLDLEIGLPPGVLISAVPSSAVSLKAPVAEFDGATGWTFEPQGAEGATTFGNIIGPPPGLAVSMTTDPGAEPAGYNVLSDVATALDLSVFPASGGVPITDADFFHFWIRLQFPDVDTFLVYFTSGTFTPGVRPGFGGPGVNDSYFSALFQLSNNAWTEYGIPTKPLTRGSFVAHGPAPDWSTIGGISVFATINSAVAAEIDIGDVYISSTSASGTVDPPYDYRVTDYDPRTGVEGNPSPVQPASQWITDPLNVVVLTPGAYGDAAIRQRFYRRGNTLPDNWYFLGTNTSDGGVFFDTFSDASIQDAPTVEINHDQPVTSIDPVTGDAILDHPIPIIFGPINGLFFGLGDLNRPSTFYWTLPDRLDYWPATFAQQACASAEALVTGCVWGGEGFVASHARWFRLLPDLNNAANVLSQPNGSTKGVVSRWAMCVGPDGVYFVSDDGVYRHTGGPQDNLTDEKLYPIFHGESAPGWGGAPDLEPLDFAHPELIRMTSFLNEVWLLYQDVGGTMQCLIFDTQMKTWRNATFGPVLGTGVPPAVVFGELEYGANPPTQLLFGGRDVARAYTHEGPSDDGGFIDCRALTACLDQGFPRPRKQYGDAIVKWTPNGTHVGIEAWLDDAQVQTPVGAFSLPLGAGTLQRSVDLFGPDPLEGRNVALALTWFTDDTHPAPVIDYAGVSYFVQPDTTIDRIGDWDDGGAPGEKYLKGCVIDVDTGGANKTVNVEATLYDGTVVVVATLIINTNGRRKLTFTWARQAVSFMRITPTDDVAWVRWAWQWIFDEEPLALVRWETEPLDFAIAGWKMIPEMWLTLRTTAGVTLTVTAFYDNGGSAVETYAIASTGGVKRSFRQTLRAGKAVLYSFLFTADDESRWRLYREETTVLVKAIGASDYLTKHPFGNDDLDLVRGIQSAEGTAAAPGGGEG